MRVEKVERENIEQSKRCNTLCKSGANTDRKLREKVGSKYSEKLEKESRVGSEKGK